VTSSTRETRSEACLGRAIEAWLGRTRRVAGSVALGCLLVGTAAGAYTAARLGMHADIHAMVDDELPFMQRRRAFEQSFPLVDDMLLLVVDAKTPEAASRAADALADRLAQERDVFHAAFVPGGGPFFERNALLYMEPDALDDLADVLAQAQPFLAELERNPNLGAVFELLTDSLAAIASGEAAGLDAPRLFERVAIALEAVNRRERPPDAWRELLVGEWGLEDETRRVVLLSPKLDLDAFQPAGPAVERVRRVVADEGLAEAGVRARLTGDFVLTYEENEVLVGQAAAVGAVSFVLVGILLAMAMRSAWMIAATLATLLVGLATSLAFAAAAVGHLNPVSIAFPVLFIGLSADFGIHLCLRYRELRSAGHDHARALADTGRGVGSSMVICAVTTAIGFFAFVPTEFIGVAQLGWIAGVGMLLSLFFSLTLLPALLCLAPARVQAGWAAPVPMATALDPPLRHPRAVRLLALGIGLGGLALVPKAYFDPNQLHVRDPNTESVQAFQDLLADSRTSPWTVSALTSEPEVAHALARRLEALDEVERAVAPADLVPSEQAEKLEVIRDIASFMGPPARGAVESPSAAVQLAALRTFEIEAAAFARENPDLAQPSARLAAATAALRARIEAADDPAAELDELELVLLEPIRWRLGRLRRSLEAEPFTLDDLPQAMRDQMIGVDGHIRVEAFPRDDLDDPAQLARFVDRVREIEPEVSGHALYLVEFGRSMVRSFQQAFVTAALAIGVLLYVLWRRLDDTLLVLGTLGLAAVLTTAAAVLVGIPFNFADVIALPLLLGMGVDSSIHLVHRFRTEATERKHLLHSSTARAVTYSGLTTLASFGSLAFAPHRGIASIGQLLTVGVLMMLLCNLVVLPAMLPRDRQGNGPADPRAR
jgi:hypothetical protein